jgi:hypothetical protein
MYISPIFLLTFSSVSFNEELGDKAILFHLIVHVAGVRPRDVTFNTLFPERK